MTDKPLCYIAMGHYSARASSGNMTYTEIVSACKACIEDECQHRKDNGKSDLDKLLDFICGEENET